MRYRLGIVTTHPIQYQVPWFRALAAEPDVDLTVYFCQLPDRVLQGDGFGVEFEWDIPLLEGYPYQVLRNVAQIPSVTAFRGCDTPEVYQTIRRDRFDAIIVNGWVAKSCLQTLLACRRSGVPCIVRGESNALRSRAWWKKLIHRGLLSQYAAFLYIGESNAQFYRSHGVRPERLFPGRYCVDNERFASAAEKLHPQRRELRKAWGISEHDVVFLYCGKFIPKKHPMTLLRAASLAQRRGSPLRLLMVGDGVLRRECEQFAEEQQLPATFAGFLNQSRLPEAYAAADCLVLPSDDGETWGLVVNEAMSCGLPAIVSDRVGCGPDLIIPGQTGERFALSDISAFADILSLSAADRCGLERMGQSARRHVANYSIEALTAGTLAAMDYVCRAGKTLETRSTRHA